MNTETYRIAWIDRMDDSTILGWALKSGGAVVAALAMAVAVLFKMNESRNNKHIEELKTEVKECKDDREVIRKAAIDLGVEVTDLKVRIAQLELKIGEQA